MPITRLYFSPHQDDEFLTLGISIANEVARHGSAHVHVILCTDGSQSSVRRALRSGKRCALHEGRHLHPMSVRRFVEARDREFLASCHALGVDERNVHVAPTACRTAP